LTVGAEGVIKVTVAAHATTADLTSGAVGVDIAGALAVYRELAGSAEAATRANLILNAG
jgi:hypothetical protein